MSPAGLAARLGRDDRRTALRLSRSASTRSPRDTSSSGPARPRWTGAASAACCSTWEATCASAALDRTIAIADPRADSETSRPIAYVEVRDKAVSTSGRSQRGFRIGGRWYSHKLDPRSGRPVERVASATVIADRSADADALATIFNVLAPEDSVRLARTIPGVECLIVASDGVVTRSDGWGRYERPAPGPLALNRAGGRKGDKEAPAGAGPSLGRRVRAAGEARDQPPDHRQAALPAPLPRRLGRGQGRTPGPHPGPLGPGRPGTARDGSPT